MEMAKENKKRTRKVVLHNLTEGQFIEILKRVCRPIDKLNPRKQGKVAQTGMTTRTK